MTCAAWGKGTLPGLCKPFWDNRLISGYVGGYIAAVHSQYDLWQQKSPHRNCAITRESWPHGYAEGLRTSCVLLARSPLPQADYKWGENVCFCHNSIPQHPIFACTCMKLNNIMHVHSCFSTYVALNSSRQWHKICICKDVHMYIILIWSRDRKTQIHLHVRMPIHAYTTYAVQCDGWTRDLAWGRVYMA